MLIIAKLLIFLLCALQQFHALSISISSIAVLLFAMILSAVPLIIKTDTLGERGVRILTDISWSVFLLSSFFVPGACFYVPLALMDVYGQRLILSCVPSIISLCFVPSHAVPLILYSAAGILMQKAFTDSARLSAELKNLRDTSKERQLLEEERTRRLIEKQDAEIYAATLKERNRIAREIHDNVGHMLTRSILQVGAIKTINTNEALAEPLTGLHETLNTAMTNIRSSVHDLHDKSIDLQAALREITDAVDTIQIHLNYDMGEHVPRTVKYCFISITKEAVNNTLKHSNATQMHIIVQEHPAFYQLLIEDNGTTKRAVTEGMGLNNMRDRVRALDGNIKITAENGFKILVTVQPNKGEH